VLVPLIGITARIVGEERKLAASLPAIATTFKAIAGLLRSPGEGTSAMAGQAATKRR
jgi:hypothetical protein